MIHGFVVCCGIRLQDNSNFATVDIVVEINDSETAVIAKQGDSAIEIDSKQLVAMSQINSVIKEGGSTAFRMPAVPTHRSAPSVSMMAGEKLLQPPLTMT